MKEPVEKLIYNSSLKTFYRQKCFFEIIDYLTVCFTTNLS